jgi:Na+/melibiose symporter-like transporter
MTIVKRDGLGSKEIAAYAVGHFCNDLCAAAWFTYVLYYLQEVVKLGQEVSGLAMLSGQIADGITTPIVGLLSDKVKTRIGYRAPWYILGTFIVVPSFLGIFVGADFFDFTTGSTTQHAYYIALPAVFNVGWAFVQISNMALVNSITYSTQRRDSLISLRNGFTYVANLSVLTIALALFALIKQQ